MFSTIEPMHDEMTESFEPEDIALQRVGPRLLTDEERHAYLQMLLKGASPAGICGQLDLPYSAVTLTLRQCADFRENHTDALTMLNQNVEAVVYQHAMKGSVPAMTLWLRNRPPPGWAGDEETEDSLDEFERLSDVELIELARTTGVRVPVAFTEGVAETGSELSPE
jgi:hypothetical protein